MKKRSLELCMGVLLLAGIFFLSGEAVQVMNGRGSQTLVVVDPGHGGIDPGMVGVSGVLEKDVNLAVSGKLSECLKKEGYGVLLTRTEDCGLYDEGVSNKKVQDLQRRCALIAEKRPELSVSIHQNSYPDPSVSGPQVFYYANSVGGEKLAAAVQESLNTALSVEHPRKEKGNTSYYLLKKSEGVLIIVECGFLSNAREEELLVREDYQQRVAQAVCDGIKTYLDGKVPGE